MDKNPLVIVGYARTPIGGLLGELKDFSAIQLGAEAIKAAISRAGLNSQDIQEVFMGCVLPAGLGQAPARQASLLAGIPNSVGCTTINKVCGSGMKSIMLANPELITVAGGMESMTNSPYLLLKARQGYRAGHAEIKDHMFLDGLEDAYEKKLMGLYAEQTAKKYNISREQQDQFTLVSLQRAQQADFSHEIIAVNNIDKDELPQKAKPEKIPQLKPAFDKDNGTVTAANSSSISDGAAALVIMSLAEAQKRNLKPIAKIIGSATHAQEPAWFTTAPVGAIQKLIQKINWDTNTVDLFEINEAFAVVTLVAMQELKISHDKVNVHGGACALGHPIGASGARIVVTLLSALQQRGLKRGVASLCIGGGEATALAVEMM